MRRAALFTHFHWPRAHVHATVYHFARAATAVQQKMPHDALDLKIVSYATFFEGAFENENLAYTALQPNTFMTNNSNQLMVY